MVDKIIDVYEKQDKLEIESLKEEVLESNKPQYLFLYIYYFHNQDNTKLHEKLLNSSDYKYISYVFKHIDKINEEEYMNKIIESNNPKLIFYSIHGRKNVKDTSVVKAIQELLKYPEDSYKYLLCYLYFNLYKKYNEEIIDLMSTIIPSLTKENYLSVFKEYKDANKCPIKEHEGYSMNIYKGHNGHKPNIIVCHTSFDYGKIIENFYNEASEVSAHYAISCNGEYKQFLSLEDSPWSNGTSKKCESDYYYRHSKNPIIKSTKDNANYFTFSIEHESIDGHINEKQYTKTLMICSKIIDYYKETYHEDFIIDSDHIIGHCDVSPIVKSTCPGSNFPLKRLIKDLQTKYNQ